MADPSQFPVLLSSVPTTGMGLTLVRKLPDLDLHASGSPDFLRTSGKPNRYNSVGSHCIYFSEDEPTATHEYESGLGSLLDKNQPVCTFSAMIDLQRVIDLANSEVLKHLGLTLLDLNVVWRGARTPTVTQALGDAVAINTHGISAIRYPSDAARRAGKTGFNVVIFRDCVKPPDYVRILGPDGATLQEWP
jgi:RES domain-containing protein